MGPPRLASREAWRSVGETDVVGVDDGGAGGAGKSRTVRLPSEMDRRRRRAARSSRRCWLAAKGALSSPRANTVFGTVLDDASTSARDGSGVRVLPGDDEAEVAEIWCDPASLSIGAGVVIPEGVWERFKLVARDGCLRVLPSRSEGLDAKR